MKWLLAVAVVLCAVSTVWAGPKVTKVGLGTAVAANLYLAVGHDEVDTAGTIWVMPGQKIGDVNSGSPPYGLPPAAPAPMEGDIDGWGTCLVQLSDQDFADIAADPTIIGQNMPTNANTQILGEAQGPVNKKFISLADAGIPAGTSVEFTIDMDGLVPHVVGIIGGAEPVVTYDATGTGTLVVISNTLNTTSQAGDAFNSIIGVMLVTDQTKFGATPLKLICQTDAWVGDIFPLLPGLDSDAAVPGNGGSMGSLDAKFGLTIYGPTGQSRTAYLYAPDASLQALFGTTDKAQLSTYINQEKSTATVNENATNWGGEKGMSVVLIYTFASPKDVAIGGLAGMSPLSITPSALKAGQGFTLELKLNEDITEPFDFYLLADAGQYGVRTIYLNGAMKKGIKALSRNVPRRSAGFSTTITPRVRIPAAMAGNTLTFYACAVKTGKLPPVSSPSQLTPKTANVIFLGKSARTVSQ